ncbi:MAG: hypothetical protein Q8S18_01825 [Bacteroidales bacterium]|nr:hypothetical protein [Bacteroidales bacterium]
MKKTSLFIILMMFVWCTTSVTAATVETKETDKTAVASSNENTLTKDEMKVLTLRVEEIRDMDKTDMTKVEKRELRNELKAIKKEMRDSGGVVYIGGATLILIIILIILLV